MPDANHPLPTDRQWESAEVADYVWATETVRSYGAAADSAGQDLASVADSLHGIRVDGFWTGPAATAFLQLRDRVVPAVRGLAAMHTDAAAALDTWQRQLGVYQHDCRASITTGRGGWAEYEATRAPEGLAAMHTGRTGIARARDSRDTAVGQCRIAIDAATARADAPTQPLAPSGQAPVPFTGPIATGRQRPMVDPANGRVVLPVTGVYPPGQPWPYVYADGS